MRKSRRECLAQCFSYCRAASVADDVDRAFVFILVSVRPFAPNSPRLLLNAIQNLRPKTAAAARLDASERVTSLHTQVRCETSHIRG
jgi:hypothetical protein